MSLRPPHVTFQKESLTSREVIDFHINEREIGGFNLTETLHPPGYTIPKHSHDQATFYILLQGSLTEFCGSRVEECRALEMMFTPAHELHSNLFHKSGGRCFVLELPEARLEQLNRRHEFLGRSARFRGSLLSWLMLKLHQEFCQVDEVSPLAIEGLAMEILSEIFRGAKRGSEARPPQWLARARGIIRGRYAESFTLSEIAAAVGVHPNHLARAFRQFFHCTVGDYVRRLRIEEAMRYLYESSLSLTEIAMAVGFSDQSHFSRLFKAHTGLTPTQFRARLRSR